MTADLIIRNGKIYGQKDKTAIAIRQGEIMEIGKEDDAEEWDAGCARVIDAGGKSVVPGFTDAHLHATMCTELYITKLIYNIERGETEPRESYIERILQPVSQYAEENPHLPIVRATGWNPSAFQSDPQGPPTRYDVDKACADRPVMLRSYDHHCILVNSKALELAGIDRDTPDPRNGVVMRDKEGNPTGFFQELTALDLFLDSLDIADFSVEEYKDGIMAFQNDYAFPNGITCIFDAYARKNAIEAYRQLAQEGKLKLRVRTALLADPSKPMTQFDKMIEEKGSYDVGDIFKIETIKFFCDGEGLAFFMNEPFEAKILEDNGYAPDYRGYAQWNEEEMKEAFLVLSKGGFQIHVHAMGDGAVKQTLNAFEYVDACGVKGRRNTIAHIMNIDEEDILRMRKLQVIASMQPTWPVIDDFAELLSVPLLGKKRVYNQYPIGRLKRNGVVVASGTDFPVLTDISPFLGIQIGMTRTTPKSSPNYETYKGILSGPDQDPAIDCMSLDEMLESYTLGGAYQAFLEDLTGSIEAGKSADLLILDCNIEEKEPMDLETVKIRNLIFQGEEIKREVSL